MNVHRRTFLHLAAGGAVLPAMTRIASAQAYPTRPVHVIVGFPPGSGPDIVGRVIGQWLGERLGQAFVIENRPGASSNIATETVVRASPDGYTLLLVTTANPINASLYDNLSFNLIRDLAPVAMLDRETFIMVANPSVPAKTVPEFIAYAKANPDKITMASAGIGSAPHVFGELFKTMTGVDLRHVPYRSNPLPDLLSGQVDVFFSPLQMALEYIQTGKLRAFGVTSATRSETLPDVPALGEFVPGYEAGAWLGMAAPKQTPPEVIERLNRELNVVLANPEVKARLATFGATPVTTSPAEFGKFVANETEKWGKVIRTANIKLE